MAFLSSNLKKGSVTPVGNKTKTNATKTEGLPTKNNNTQQPALAKTSGNTGEAKTETDWSSKNSASMWSVFQDRLLKKDNPSAKSSPFLLNEELKRVESRVSNSPARRSLSKSEIPTCIDMNMKGRDKNILLLSQDTIQELELLERSLPDRWLDFFCIVGLDPKATLVQEEGASSGAVPLNKPVLLDRYPKEVHSDMEFPEHLPTFCFPNGGCRPTRHKMRHQDSQSSTKETKAQKSFKKKNNNNIKYHHNAPDPYLCSMVLTSGSGHRLYCTALTVYEMREDKKQVEEEKKVEEPEQESETVEESPPAAKFNKNWWEEPGIESMSKNIEKTREEATTISKAKDEYYWMVPKCLVLMSHYPFFQAQSIALKELFYTVQSGVSPIPFERYVAHILDDVPLPRSGIARQPKSQSYTVVEWMSWIKPAARKASKISPTIRLERPPPNRLPLLNVSMEPLFRTLSLSNILVIWANLLQEGKVVLSCSNSETTALLAPISEALLALLFPLEWQGIYVPVLPNQDAVLDLLEAPVPYLIGLVTKPSQAYNPQSHPNGVLWCDLDNDTLHLGFKGDQIFYNQNNDRDGEEIPLLPALPSEASMALKAELEEIADPLYLPTIEGIKGRITVGDRTVELDNALRQPYAQKTKLFDQPMATPRKYILTQSSKIPPRGKALKYEDFSIVPNKKTDKKAAATPSVGVKTDEDEVNMCGLNLDDIQIPCGEDTTDIDIIPIGQENEKGEEIAKPEINAMDEDSDSEGAPKATATSQDSTFLLSLKRQSRSMQAHVDRAMAVLGQDYATPSKYAARSKRQFGEDVLSRQDEIAANFFSVDPKENRNVSERVRESFLRFFLVTFARYKFFFDFEMDRLDEDRFVASLNFSHRQKEYVKEVVTSQMFEIFMQDTRSIRNRKLFDEYIVKHKNGNFGIGEHKESTRSYGTPLLDSSQWRNPTIVVPAKPCRVGLKEGRIYCHDRRFPDNLDPDECITNRSVSFWKMFLDGSFCSAFSGCI
jgi:hypothetical protein